MSKTPERDKSIEEPSTSGSSTPAAAAGQPMRIMQRSLETFWQIRNWEDVRTKNICVTSGQLLPGTDKFLQYSLECVQPMPIVYHLKFHMEEDELVYWDPANTTVSVVSHRRYGVKLDLTRVVSRTGHRPITIYVLKEEDFEECFIVRDTVVIHLYVSYIMKVPYN